MLCYVSLRLTQIGGNRSLNPILRNMQHHLVFQLNLQWWEKDAVHVKWLQWVYTHINTKAWSGLLGFGKHTIGDTQEVQ